MLLEGKLPSLLNHIHLLTLEFEEAEFNDPQDRLEARYTLFHLRRLLSDKNARIDKTLLNFLNQRWDRIQNTNCQYLNDFTNPANKACVNIAKTLGKLLNKPYLTLLMPSLAKTPVESYLSSSYEDDTLDLKEVILDDSNERLIHVLEVFNNAKKREGALIHNSLFNGQPQPLSSEEQRRLLSRHPAIKRAFSAQQAVIDFKTKGPSVGAALNRLIRGLHKGGVWEEGDEDNAGYNAYTAILEFKDYLATFNQNQAALDLLFNARHTEFDLDLKKEISVSFKDYWDKLTQPLEEDHNLSADYCVQMIANFLEEILATNSILYDLAPFSDEMPESLEELEENSRRATLRMTRSLPHIEQNHCYQQDNKKLTQRLLIKLSHDRSFYFDTNEVHFFINQYQKAQQENDPTTKRLCANIIDHVGKNYSASFIKNIFQELDANEKAHFSSLTGQWVKDCKPAHQPPLLGFFSRRNNKRHREEDNPAYEFISSPHERKVN